MVLAYESGQVNFVFEDDGVGFNEATVNKSGIRNMQDRVKRLNGNVTITSSDTGTKVELTINLNKQYHGNRL